LIKINILAGDESFGLELFNGYWRPIFLHQKLFQQLKIKFKFFSKISKKIFYGDFLIISSRFFGTLTSDPRNSVVLNFLENSFKKDIKIIWFDLRDSAGTTQFQVLPYVDFYVKKQLYKDLRIYTKDLYGGREYSNYYHKNFDIRDSGKYFMQKLDLKFKKKILLGWNLGVRNFSFFTKPRFIKLSLFLKNKIEFALNKNISLNKIHLANSPKKKYNIFANNRTEISRNSVRFQRELFRKKINLKYFNDSLINTDVPFKKFYKTLFETKILLSLFGWGEVCYKEFEATVCGCAFVSPNMSNILTWPNIYKKEETYIPVDWNLNNINSILTELIKNDELRCKLVKNAQNEIKSIESENGKKFLNNLFKTFMNG
tara:strand:+ start:298 stop:1413 length:1116 start_codon:yes stop_codon:yes gene_type:complete